MGFFFFLLFHSPNENEETSRRRTPRKTHIFQPPTPRTAAPGTEFFVCFTSSLKMPPPPSPMSPGRQPDKPPRDPSRRLRTSGSIRGQSSPMLFGPGKKRGAGFEPAEPSSPKVTCIGQVRVKTKNKRLRTRGAASAAGEVSFRRQPQNVGGGSSECLPQRNQRWGQIFGFKKEISFSICEAIREYTCFLPCSGGNCGKSSDSKEGEKERAGCGAVFAKWLMVLQDGEDKRVNVKEDEEIHDIVRSREMLNKIGGDKDAKRDFVVGGFFKEEEVEEEVLVCEEEEISKEEEIVVPPRNALLLMRCRSDPVRMAALASRFWESPTVRKLDDEEEENDDDDEEDGDEEEEEEEVFVEAKEEVTGEEEKLVEVEEEEKGEIKVKEEGKENDEDDEEGEDKEVILEEDSFEGRMVVVGREEGGEEQLDIIEFVDAIEAQEESRDDIETEEFDDEENQEKGVEVEEVAAIKEETMSALENECKEEETGVSERLDLDQQELEIKVESAETQLRIYEDNEEETEETSQLSQGGENSEKEGEDQDEPSERKTEIELPVAVTVAITEEEREEKEMKVTPSHDSDLAVKEEKQTIQVVVLRKGEESVCMDQEKEEEAMTTTLEKEEEATTTLERGIEKSEKKELRKHEKKEMQIQLKEEKKGKESPSKNALPECLLLMMYEPKLSMEVSKETWVCSRDFLWHRPSRQDRQKFQEKAAENIDAKGEEKPRKKKKKSKKDQEVKKRLSTDGLPSAMAKLIEEKLVSEYEPFVLTRCKSEPVMSSASVVPETCLWKARRLYRPSHVAIGF